MEMILEWLPKFRDKIMPFLTQEGMNLPTDSISLGKAIETGMIIPGVVLISIAIIGLVSKYIVKRRSRLNKVVE